MADTTAETTEYRIEHDTMGEVRVPANALYRAQTQRAVENFPISGKPLEPQHIVALAQIKKAAATANAELGVLDDDEVSFPGVEVVLRPGESLILYTDGVIEARAGGELLGEDRLLDAISGCAGMSAQGIADRVRAAAERHVSRVAA